MVIKLTDFFIGHIMPYGIWLGAFYLLISWLEERWRKADLVAFWKRKVVKISVIGGLIAVLLRALYLILKPWLIKQAWYNMLVHGLSQFWNLLTAYGVIATVISYYMKVYTPIKTYFIDPYWALWMNAFVVTFGICIVIELFALRWRVAFARAINILIFTVLSYPKIFSYLWGYQTPIEDILLANKIKAKLRENLNDSYEDALQGYDENGKKFENGAGGTSSTQTKKATALAMRRSSVKVRTTMDGTRKAKLFVLQSREAETDRSIEGVLKGFGERVSGDSVYFPSEVTYSQKDKGYVLDSSVPFNAGTNLGSWTSIFVDPLAIDNKVSVGGYGFVKVYKQILVDMFKYLQHLTPLAVYQRIVATAESKFKIDTSAEKAKYKIQHNLDLSVLDEPKDPDTGNDIATQRKIAIQHANARIKDITNALSMFKISGQFAGVQVGGNTAIYEYTLPPDPNLPNDFNKIQDGISQILRIKSKPIIKLNAGQLSVSIDNEVNIPISFADMIKRRKQGVSNIISGMVGIDAMGEPIYFELGDKNPHAMFFGKTGTGKTVSLEDILYSVMDATDPKHLRIAYVDGKGNSFEFMSKDSSHPNPFTYAPPGDASGDIEYSRAVIMSMEAETRRRIDLFKKAEVAKLSEYNKMMEEQGKEILPEILFVVDEFSAITQQDQTLRGEDAIKKNTVDKFEYIAKMSRSVGIRMLLANQSARKELVPGKISANVTGRVSLGVSEPIEAEIALPETGIAVNLLSQPGEFYSIMNGPMNPEHGNSPYIPQEQMNRLNDALIKKFGPCEYVMTREDILAIAETKNEEGNKEGSADKSKSYPVPNPAPTKETPLDEIAKLDDKYLPWLADNLEVVSANNESLSSNPAKRIPAINKGAKIIKRVDKWTETQEKVETAKTHARTGSRLSSFERVNRVTSGREHRKL